MNIQFALVVHGYDKDGKKVKETFEFDVDPADSLGLADIDNKVQCFLDDCDMDEKESWTLYTYFTESYK